MSPSATVLILGATSDIARAIACRYAGRDAALQLAGRDPAALEREAADLRLRYRVAVSTHVVDMLDPATHDPFLDSLDPLPDVAICVVGWMGAQADNARDPNQAARVIETNLTGPARVLGALANRFAARGSGTLVGIGSVSGDRGRAKNYIYGAAKAGFAAFLSGLRNRLHGTGVHVVTVKPGFVRTRMTEGLDLPRPLTADPDTVARAVRRAVDRRRNVVYTLPVWRLVMTVIRAIPEPLFKRLDL